MDEQRRTGRSNGFMEDGTSRQERPDHAYGRRGLPLLRENLKLENVLARKYAAVHDAALLRNLPGFVALEPVQALLQDLFWPGVGTRFE
ncbi:MAG: hypothetical protein M1830_004824 [Pleopsidium flavum]|nr:MAG: hypothetical protein M1830_004824 [Pleopsidium flavum]